MFCFYVDVCFYLLSGFYLPGITIFVDRLGRRISLKLRSLYILFETFLFFIFSKILHSTKRMNWLVKEKNTFDFLELFYTSIYSL